MKKKMYQGVREHRRIRAVLSGIALPFISYGGTALFTLLCEIAMTLSVARVSVELFYFKRSKNI